MFRHLAVTGDHQTFAEPICFPGGDCAEKDWGNLSMRGLP